MPKVEGSTPSGSTMSGGSRNKGSHNVHQHYPTYAYKERDIVLKEFEGAQGIANSQIKVFSQSSGLLAGILTIIIPLFLKDGALRQVNDLSIDLLIFFAIIILFLCYLLLIYFVELWKTIVINRRKVIVLRTILDLDYGSLQLILPRWRMEGATSPFVIKMFPGWISIGAFPFWIIAIFVSVLFYLAYPQVVNHLPLHLSANFALRYLWYTPSAFAFIFFAYQFRKRLLDTYETMDLQCVKRLISIIKLYLVDNFEYIIYRAKLAIDEMQRLEIEFSNVKAILISIEDKRFEHHSGVDYRALARSLFFVLKNGFLYGGGSTITMQLARTLFIKSDDYNKTLRRKVAEILLARFWLNIVFSKKAILDMYLCAVRFEKNVDGIKAASDYFFGEYSKKNFSSEEAFFLIERLSSKGAIYSIERIKSLIKRVNKNSDIKLNLNNVFNVYRRVEGLGKVKCS